RETGEEHEPQGDHVKARRVAQAEAAEGRTRGADESDDEGVILKPVVESLHDVKWADRKRRSRLAANPAPHTSPPPPGRRPGSGAACGPPKTILEDGGDREGHVAAGSVQPATSH